jgi:SAM-dependent methyltransferase
MRYARERSIELLEICEGARILDVGCGAGDDARAMAVLVGRSGRVTAIDIDPVMIAEATRRSDGMDLPVEFRLGDVYTLPDADASFEASRAERVFLHLAEPERALAQIVRVVKPGGKVVVLERDIETRTIDVPNRAVTRRLVNFWCDRFLGGWIGRQLPRLFTQAGLLNITIDPVTVVDTDFEAFDAQYDLTRIVRRAEAAGALTREEGTEWLAHLDAVVNAGSFFTSMTNFIVSGRKP